MGIILGALGGLGEGVAQVGAEGMRRDDAMDLERVREQNAANRALALMQAQEAFKNAPLQRLSVLAQQKMGERLPVDAEPVTEASGQDPQLSANALGIKGMTGKYADLVALAKNLPSEDQQPYLDQLKRQFGTDQASAQAAVAGKTRGRTSDEAFNAALDAAKVSDPVAYAAGRPLATDKTITVGDGATIIDAKTGKVIFKNYGKSDRQLESENNRATLQSNQFAHQEKLKRMELDPLGINAATAGDASTGAAKAIANGVHGTDLLNELNPSQAEIVKALAEGRVSFPSGAALRSPTWQGLITLVGQYDPTFDAVNYGARAATRKDFTSGKAAQSANALNTVLGHLDSLGTAADELNNTSIPLWNSLANSVSSGTGDPRVKKFEATKKAVVDELTRAWRGSGGSEGDIKTWSSTLDAANSPDQLHGVIGQLGELLESKIGALNDQYGKGMGVAANGLNLMSPNASKVLQKIKQRAGMDTSGRDAGTGQAAAGQVLNYNPATGGFN